MSPALALTTALEHIAAARLEIDRREWSALLDMAERLVRDVLADYTPVQPVVQREALRKSSQNLRAVTEDLKAAWEATSQTKGPIK